MIMEVITKIADLQKKIADVRTGGNIIGMVPTMVHYITDTFNWLNGVWLKTTVV